MKAQAAGFLPPTPPRDLANKPNDYVSLNIVGCDTIITA